jgi:hypothetical protein
VSDQALLVGCDAYPGLPGGDLRAAVRDVLSVRDWLLRSSGGGLTRRDVILLVSCSDQGAQVAPVDVDGPASRVELARAVGRLVKGPDRNRLYVYFAGHGCRTDPVNPLKSRDALLLTDFTPDDPAAASVGVDDLRIRLTMAPFREVILIVDACRNLPFREPFDLGGLGRDLAPRAGGPGGTSRAYVFQATAPAERAVGAEYDGVLRGVFSRALTDGLDGIGDAKFFDDTDTTGRPYKVRWSTLCNYVAQSVRDQDPRYYGEGDPVLVAFPDESFGPVRLDVGIDPGPATEDDLAQLRAQVIWPVLDDGEDGALTRPGPAPITFRVPPRRNRVMIRAGNLVAKQSFDVYADTSVQLVLKRPATAQRGGERLLAPALAGVARSAVDITSNDPASVLQLRDSSGRVRASGVERLAVEIAPGSYTAVAIGLGGTEIRQPADLFPDQRTSIRLHSVACGGWPARANRLAWASPAAWVAGANPGTWSSVPDGSGIVAAAVYADQEAAGLPASVTPVRFRPGNRSTPVHAHLVHSTPSRAVLDMPGVRLDAPVLAGAVTSIVVSDEETSVGLFDLALLDDPHLVAMLDRAQNLLGAGRSGLAEVLLTRVQRDSSSLVAGVLLEGIRSSAAPPILARGTPPAVAHALLGGTPWAVLINPPHRSGNERVTPAVPTG